MLKKYHVVGKISMAVPTWAKVDWRVSTVGTGNMVQLGNSAFRGIGLTPASLIYVRVLRILHTVGA